MYCAFGRISSQWNGASAVIAIAILHTPRLKRFDEQVCDTFGHGNSPAWNLTGDAESGQSYDGLVYRTLGGLRLRRNPNGTLTATIAEAEINSDASPLPTRSQEAPIDSPTTSEQMEVLQRRRYSFALDTVKVA